MLQQTDKAISVYREIARIHREAHRPQERMSALQRILELNPRDQEALTALNRTAAASGQHFVPPGAGDAPPTGSVSNMQVSREVSAPPTLSTSGLSNPSGILYVEEEVEEGFVEASTVSDSLPEIEATQQVYDLEEEFEEIEEAYEVDELYASEPPEPMPRPSGRGGGGRVIPLRSLDAISYEDFLAIPLVSTQVAPAAAFAPSLMEQTLELADSYLIEGHFTQARAIVSELQMSHPDHPLVLDKAREIDELAAASSGVSAVAQPLHPEAAFQSDPPELEMEYEELTPGDEGFDFAEKLAEELAEVAEIAPMDEGAEQIDVETVFEQFKKGVAEQVDEDDSDTHFDLGIAYKEMGLLPDARREFQVAMADPRRRCLCWTMIGLIYMEEGQPHLAVEAFQSGLESPEKTQAEAVGLHYELGLACEAAGSSDQARLHYQYVHQRDPQFREVGQRLARLGGPQETTEDLMLESMDDVNRAFDALIHED
jgi:tetratricopeptide (TPR) repeat protein